MLNSEMGPRDYQEQNPLENLQEQQLHDTEEMNKTADGLKGLAENLLQDLEGKEQNAEDSEQTDRDANDVLNANRDHADPSFGGHSQGYCRRSQTPQNYCILNAF